MGAKKRLRSIQVGLNSMATEFEQNLKEKMKKNWDEKYGDRSKYNVEELFKELNNE